MEELQILRNHSIIAIEGIDGSGKTTVAKELADKINGVYFRTPNKEFDECRKFFERDSRSPLSRFFFYLAANWEAWEQINRLAERYPVILDRYLLSTKIYHQVLLEKSPKMELIIKKYFYQISPPEPDVNIILRISVAKANERLLRAGKGNVCDKRLEEDKVFQDKVSSLYSQTKGNVHFVDVEGKTLAQVVMECEKIFNNMFEKNRSKGSY